MRTSRRDRDDPDPRKAAEDPAWISDAHAAHLRRRLLRYSVTHWRALLALLVVSLHLHHLDARALVRASGCLPREAAEDPARISDAHAAHLRRRLLRYSVTHRRALPALLVVSLHLHHLDARSLGRASGRLPRGAEAPR